LANVLEDHFPGELEFQPLKDPGTTGNFEVTILNNNTLIHSKTTKGQGKAESQAERDAIIAAINAYKNSK